MITCATAIISQTASLTALKDAPSADSADGARVLL